MTADTPSGEILTEADLRDPKRGADHGARDPLAAADGLEPPDLNARLMAWVAASAIVFILVAMALLYGFYHLLLANASREPVHAFPTPRLETSINPRDAPSEPEPGPAPVTLHHPTAEPQADIGRAMQAVAARGAHAYDPLPASNTAGPP